MIVPSQERPLRLRWLLNALEEQTLERPRFEVIVGHSSAGPETEELVRSHPLARDGTLRDVRLPPGRAPGANRNAAMRLARGDVLAFTDDDCRPPPEWLERAVDAARRHPGAVIQGTTRPDPHEFYLLDAAPHARSQSITPPGPWAQTCNIVYPRALVERVGGFDETMRSGEDTDLAIRAQEAGAPYLGAPEVLTWHAVDAPSLRGRLRSLGRWQDLTRLVKRHPGLRRHYAWWVFWKPTHAWLGPAVAGLALERRRRGAGLLALPWVLYSLPRYGALQPPEPEPVSSLVPLTPASGASARGRVRALLELPGRFLIDLTEMAVLARGSIRNRTFLL